MASATNGYTAHDIDVLRGLDPVKQVPSMYTRIDDPTHIIQEVSDASGNALEFPILQTESLYTHTSPSGRDGVKIAPAFNHPRKFPAHG